MPSKQTLLHKLWLLFHVYRLPFKYHHKKKTCVIRQGEQGGRTPGYKPFHRTKFQGLCRQFNGTSTHKILLEIFTESLVSILRSNCNILLTYSMVQSPS